MGARKITFHEPHSVEEENCGWDVTSLLGGQVARYIEVKGRAGVGGVALTPNEWMKAQRFGKDYWLNRKRGRGSFSFHVSPVLQGTAIG